MPSTLRRWHALWCGELHVGKLKSRSALGAVMQAGMLIQAAGSAYVEFGNTKVMAGMCAHRAASLHSSVSQGWAAHSHVFHAS